MSALQRIACRIVTLLLLLCAASTTRASLVPEQWAHRPVEIRGVWMDKGSIPKTEDGIRKLIRGYAKAGINIVHPEVIFNGYAAYPSSYLPQKDLWNGLDMLGILIDEAHKHGIEVHPWVWVFRVGNVHDKDGILKEHPEWAAINKAGRDLSRGNAYWLCPSIPAARWTILRAITEIVQKYPVDGIQLDYIRFDHQDGVPYCYNDSCRTRFQAEYGIDPMEIEPFTEPVVRWHMWRENLVNTFVAKASREVKAISPEIMVSAAVGSRPEDARLYLLQDWRHWVINGWVDFIAPMDYTNQMSSFLEMVCEADESIGAFGLLAPGVGLYLHEGSEPMLEQVNVARTVPVPGVTLFAAAYLNEDRLKALASGPFAKPARLPFRLPVQGAKELASTAGSRLTDSATVGDLTAATVEFALAKHILDYVLIRSDPLSYGEPLRPDIFIPDVFQPLPSVEVPGVKAAPVVDGKLDDAAWQSAGKAKMDITAMGGEVTQPTEVSLAYDSKNLYLAFRCAEPKLGAVRAEVRENDGLVFQDDSVEIFVALEDGNDGYVQFAVNAIGTRYESKGWLSSWNVEWQAAVGRERDTWTVEAAIPFTSLGEPPAVGQSWRVNFCRNRVLGHSEAENMCWSATYGSFHTPVRFGKLVFVREGG